MKLFTVYDSASKTYSEPRAINNERDAVDAFTQAANQDDNPFCKYPADFTLMSVGVFDERTGVLEATTPLTIINAAAVKNAEQPQQ